MPFEIGDEITTAGDSPDDRPAVGELRQIVHHMGITLATYRVTAVWPPVAMGALWRICRPGGWGGGCFA